MSLRIFFTAMSLLAWCGSAQIHANNLIVNGNFELPNVDGGYALFTNGQVPGWNNTAGDGEIEIDASGILGGPAYQSTQSMEVNATTFDTVSQVVSGLVVGDNYVLSWAYGDRPGSGPQEMNVLFGGNLVTTNVDTFAGSNQTLVWNLNSFLVTAAATTETLSFQSILTTGLPSYGNEIDAVSLVATPDLPPILLLLTGLGLLGSLWRKQALKA
ncbi:MAG: hypothetical protein ACP5E2_00710 [Terracidiphilus sp.]